MTVALLYTAHNRLAYTEATFAALLANTTWERVDRLLVLDDASQDGTAEHLMAETADFYGRTGGKCDCVTLPFGGPVAAMNHALDVADPDVLVKVDNDLIVCPGWLDVLLDTLAEHPSVLALGFEPGFGDDLASSPGPRAAKDARFIGGVGAYRRQLFARRRPVAKDRFFGLTTFLRDRGRCAWLSPDLPCFLLDHLPFEPWRGLAAEYCERGWSRSWTAYPAGMAEYWSWWAPHWREAVA